MTTIDRKRAKLLEYIRQIPGVIAAAIWVRGEVVTVIRRDGHARPQ